jgi:uncharacterized protein (DUF736 family)
VDESKPWLPSAHLHCLRQRLHRVGQELNIKARFVASEKENEKPPDYRVFAGVTEFGAAWRKTTCDSDREYISVKLDYLSFRRRSMPRWSRLRATRASP